MYFDPQMLLSSKESDAKELFRHLELRPYIRIPLNFDYKACLAEALSLLQYFRPNCGDLLSDKSRSAQWKALALRAIAGDPGRTNFERSNHLSSFRMTYYADRCPKTLEFLKNITQLEKCQRIRFMLLEPGARIYPHSDAHHLNVYPSLNIALNMPAGCEFVIECNPDGSWNPHTKVLPFMPGDLMILNIAKFHFLHNNSDLNRIHIIFTGPIRYSIGELLRMARDQNNLSNIKDVMHALRHKYQASESGSLPQSILYKLNPSKYDPRSRF